MSAVRRPDDRHVESFDDGLVVYLPERGTLHLLDPAATRLWELLDGASVADVALAEAVSAGDRSGLVADTVREVAGQLVRAGLLQAGERPSSPAQDGDDQL